MITLKSEREQGFIRQAGELVSRTIKELKARLGLNVETIELDRIAERLFREAGAKSAFKGYRGYPGNICTSINEVVVHGIPGSQRLREGDIISIDVGVELNGYFADAAFTQGIGEISDEAERLMQVTETALYKGISQAIVNNRIGDVSCAIQSEAEKAHFSVVRQFVGHGIGSQMHEEPQIPNWGQPHIGPRLKAGMVLAIEPMINKGTWEVEVLEDGWTAVTKDRSLSAHFEHTVIVRPEGPEIVTS